MKQPTISAKKLLLFIDRIEDAINNKPFSHIKDEVASLRQAVESAMKHSSEEQAATDKPHMLLIIDVDWATMHCPCGAEICSRYESGATWAQFKQDHAEHTSGYITESATTKALVWGDPNPNLRPLIEK